jgi:hypothetical protein
MRVPHAHDVRVRVDLHGERREQRVERRDNLAQRDAHAVHLDGIFDIHRRGAEVNLAAADRRLLGEDPDLGHQVVTDLLLDGQRGRKIDIVTVRAQIVEFGLRYKPAAQLRFR